MRLHRSGRRAARSTRLRTAGVLGVVAIAIGACGSGGDDGAADDAPTSSPTIPTTTPLERLESTCAGRSRHVLVIGVDGLRPDAVSSAETPSLDAIVGGGVSTMAAYAGGEQGTPTEQPTLSGPGWTSILTGVWTDKHGVVDNEFGGRDIESYPHLFTRLRELDPDARLISLVHWIPINVVVTDADVADFGDDRTVTDAAVAELGTADPTVVFVHLDDVDGAGHGNGYAAGVPEYEAAIETVDGLVGEMTAAIESRARRGEECWATIVVTDHGGTGTVHGGQSAEERTVPLFVSGDGLDVEEVVEGPGHVAVPPTVLAYLGLPSDPAWGWDGTPFGVPPID